MKTKEKKYCLSFDTSTPVLSVALCSKTKTIFSVHEDSDRKKADQLTSLIKKMCQQKKVDILSISGIVIGVGPGSFTGLRIGVSVAKAFMVSRSIPVWPVCSFNSAFYAHKEKAHKLTYLKSALRDNFYVGECIIKNKEMVVSCSLISKDVFYKRLSNKKENVFVGESILFKKDIEKYIKNPCVVSQVDMPNAELLARVVFEYKNIKSIKDSSKLKPLYLYSDTCQIKKKKNAENSNDVYNF